MHFCCYCFFFLLFFLVQSEIILKEKKIKRKSLCVSFAPPPSPQIDDFLIGFGIGRICLLMWCHLSTSNRFFYYCLFCFYSADVQRQNKVESNDCSEQKSTAKLSLFFFFVNIEFNEQELRISDIISVSFIRK